MDLTQDNTKGPINPEKLASAQDAVLKNREEIVELIRSLIENPPRPMKEG